MRRSEKVKRGTVKLPNDEEEAARRTCLSDIPDFETFDQAESQDADGEPRKAIANSSEPKGAVDVKVDTSKVFAATGRVAWHVS